MTHVYVLLILGLNLPHEINPAAKVFKLELDCMTTALQFKEKYKDKYKNIFTSCSKEKINK